jgi:hypothetical protein
MELADRSLLTWTGSAESSSMFMIFSRLAMMESLETEGPMQSRSYMLMLIARTRPKLSKAD